MYVRALTVIGNKVARALILRDFCEPLARGREAPRVAAVELPPLLSMWARRQVGIIADFSIAGAPRDRMGFVLDCASAIQYRQSTIEKAYLNADEMTIMESQVLSISILYVPIANADHGRKEEFLTHVHVHTCMQSVLLFAKIERASLTLIAL